MQNKVKFLTSLKNEKGFNQNYILNLKKSVVDILYLNNLYIVMCD